MDKPKVVAVILARMRSTRLPRKALLPLGGKPALWWLVYRAGLAESVDEVVIATTTDTANDPIMYAKWHDRLGKCDVFRYNGNEEDIIGRMLACAHWAEADIICELTADCPLVDPRHIDLMASILDSSECDYISNDVVVRSWPDGLDIQIYKTSSLQECFIKFNPKYHCGWNIGMHSEWFNIRNWKAPSHLFWPELGLTLDTPEDYKMLCKLFDKFGSDPRFRAEDVIDFLRENSDWITNKDVKRKDPTKEG